MEKYWKIRKGLFPAVGAVRPTGTTVIIEDVAVPIEHLAPATAELQGALARHGYPEAIIFGHALDGNLHFVFAQGFGDDDAIRRYGALMDEVADIIVRRYDGSLKAEHGTGRNMAPFVEMEWGQQATELMWCIKRLLDPQGLLNPGVILNDDPQIHLKNIKPMPAYDALVDRCIECGFCEPQCPTRGLTVTPRQRIVGGRETARLAQAHAPEMEQAAFRNAFLDVSVASCTACGLCEAACPVGINTGDLTKSIRGSNRGDLARATASVVGHHYGVATGAVRLGLGAASLLDAATLGHGLDGVGSLLRGVLGKNALLVSHKATPRPGSIASRPATATVTTEAKAVVYFESCVNRMFGPQRDDAQGEGLSSTLLRLCDKAGLTVITPARIGNLCCGQPFDSKGMAAEAGRKAEEAVGALLAASDGGRWPVVIDTSPCTQSLKAAAGGRLALLDIAEFLHDHILPNVCIGERIDEPVALHHTCSSRRMGLDSKLLALAKACAKTVVVPPEVGCCGFAGDKGFIQPEINAHALRTLAPAVAGCGTGYSTSRTCEIGLSVHGGIPYRSIASLVDRVSQPLERRP